MKKENFKVVINRIRIDLGSEIFVDCLEASEIVLFDESTLPKVANKLKAFIKKRNGEFIEYSDSQITIDTMDLTIYVRIESNLGVIDDKSYNLFLNLLSAG